MQWRQGNAGFTLKVKVPANTSCEVVIPTREANAVMEGKTPATSAEGVKASNFTGQHLTLDVGSGTSEFSVAGGK